MKTSVIEDEQILPHIRLRFNIEYPLLEDCYIDGYQCASNDISEEDNPFNKGSRESEMWLQGWWAGFYGEKPLFNEEVSEPYGLTTTDFDLNAANDTSYDGIFQPGQNTMSKMAKVAAAVAATFLGYQVIDLIA